MVSRSLFIDVEGEMKMGRTASRERFTKQEVLMQLNLWLMEALSDSNDGWVKKHYMDTLKEIQNMLNESLTKPVVEFEETPDEEMCF